jgi:Zn finger protein HypA/HybF involved in hydrogenase expression
MRIAALRELSRSSNRHVTAEPTGFETAGLRRPELLRCECRECGAHCNAIVADDVHSSCPNCGAARLVPVEGSEVIVNPAAAA